MDQSTVLLVNTFVGDREQARQMGRDILERRLATVAKVTGPVETTQWWEGELTEPDSGYQLELQTTAERFTVLQDYFQKYHPSEPMPEVLAFQPVGPDWWLEQIKDFLTKR